MRFELNKIYNIDCLEFMRFMPSKSIDLVVSDPPYEIATKGGGLGIRPVCQICGKAPSDDAHHVRYGCYGADKDDRKQIAVCRAYHKWCHDHKHESIEKYERLADENWAEYEASL